MNPRTQQMGNIKYDLMEPDAITYIFNMRFIDLFTRLDWSLITYQVKVDVIIFWNNSTCVLEHTNSQISEVSHLMFWKVAIGFSCAIIFLMGPEAKNMIVLVYKSCSLCSQSQQLTMPHTHSSSCKVRALAWIRHRQGKPHQDGGRIK